MLATGNHTCFVNPDTGEVEIVFNNEMMSVSGISWDEENEDNEENMQDDDDETKAQLARIDSWQRFIRIEKPASHDSFQIMEDFVNEAISEGRLKEQFWRALSRSHPFRNFNAIVHNCDYREDWFKFKQAALEEYVKREVDF
jgi:hypothetical protein